MDIVTALGIVKIERPIFNAQVEANGDFHADFELNASVEVAPGFKLKGNHQNQVVQKEGQLSYRSTFGIGASHKVLPNVEVDAGIQQEFVRIGDVTSAGTAFNVGGRAEVAPGLELAAVHQHKIIYWGGTNEEIAENIEFGLDAQLIPHLNFAAVYRI